MARRHPDTLIFDTIRLEGSLFVPALLEKAARGDHTEQGAAAYQLPKGLSLADEQGRAFRIAGALWKGFGPIRQRQDVEPLRATIGFSSELLRDALGYSDFSLCSTPIEIHERHYPLTAMAGKRVPVIVASHDLDLDTPDEQFAVIGSGTRRKSAHQLAQQFLNASEGCTWALVTNGRQIRLLRDSDTLTRPAYLEFDLELILANDRYADFAALWRLLHASRAGDSNEIGEAKKTGAACVWERWKLEGEAQGERVRAGLRIGVQDALLALGSGFLEASGNDTLRGRIESGELTKDAYFQQLLRLVYRFLFLFTVEERGLLHAPDDSAEAREARAIYAKGYALRRLRDRSLRRVGFDRFTDLWTGIRIVFRGLANGEMRLALPALGGLFAASQCPDLDAASLENRSLLTAMRHLRWSSGTGTLSAVDYRNMGPEELGSVYESLLELIPTVDLLARTFGFAGITDEGSTAGNTRKTTGSYYTPDSLVQELIKSALDPVIAKKVADFPDNPTSALLSFSVIDPACGSGHFLIAAARRLAEKLAELRVSDGAVTTAHYRHALREVISHCIYGVDRNPMALELARTALWLEGYEPGQPLSFLDHHLQCGDALLGLASFDQLRQGIAMEAFTVLSGDHKEVCKELAATNREALKTLERRLKDKNAELFDATDLDDALKRLEAIEAMPDDSTDEVEAKMATFTSFLAEAQDSQLTHACDLLVAAYIIPKTPDNKKLCPTTATLLEVLFPQQGRPVPQDIINQATESCREARVFHWPLRFAHIFGHGGFDCVLGNPPWEVSQLGEEEYFASLEPNISALDGAKRKTAIAALETDNPRLWNRYLTDKRLFEASNTFFRTSDRFPLTAVGKLNTYPLFAESISQITSAAGRAGFIVPTGIATDDSTKAFFSSLTRHQRLIALYSFENEEFVFSGVHHAFKFCLVVIAGSNTGRPADLAFFLRQVSWLEKPGRQFSLSSEDFSLINPNTLNCPIFRSEADAELTKKIYRHVPILIEEAHGDAHEKNPWDITFSQGLFNMTSSSHLFLDEPTPESVPLYEAKMIHQFDHRWAHFRNKRRNKTGDLVTEDSTEGEKADPNYSIIPRYWVSEREVLAKLARAPKCVRDAFRNQDADALLAAIAIWIEARHEVDLLGDMSQSNARQRVLRLGGPMFSALPTEETDWLNEKALAEARDWPPLTEHEFGIISNALDFFSATHLLLHQRSPSWLMGWRDITNATNERTVVASVIPRAGCGDTLLLMYPKCGDLRKIACLLADQNSLVHDFIARQKIGGTHLKYNVKKQITTLPPTAYSESDLAFIVPRVLELTYTAHDLSGWAQDLGHDGQPFPFDPDRRARLRAELDAYYAKLYGLTLGELRYILDPAEIQGDDYPTETFRGLKTNEMRKYGEYRTRRLVLEAWDAQESLPKIVPKLPPRAPFSRETVHLYCAYLVYAWLQQEGGRLPLRRMARAFSLLKAPRRLVSKLDPNRATEAATWVATFKEPIEQLTLRPILEEMKGRGQIWFPKNDLDELFVAFHKGAEMPEIASDIKQDAELSAAAAEIELAQEIPIPSATEEDETMEYFASMLST